ncbi:MAG TPA: Hint domain-containing protein, partial [Haliangiales bacterium]|nr:Hint domain-containing protein [Haliangiales bacterium]
MKMRLAFAVLLALALVQSAWGRGGGGCFEQGTRILTPAGNVPIERLNPGDVVLTVRDGQLRRATVQGCVQVQPADYLELAVAGRKLRVTPEHP